MRNNHSRRAFLVSLAALPLATAADGGADRANGLFRTCSQPVGGPNAHRFPRVVLQDQDKRKAWFYQDLVAGRLVVFSFTSVAGEKEYPILANLVQVQSLLGDRLGKDVFLYTVTTEPHRDTPGDLKRLAEAHGARWRFLTGEIQPVREVLAAFNVRGRLSGLLWIGNERTGRWIKRPSRQPPLAIAEAVARLSVGAHHRPFLIDRHSARPGISRPEDRRRLRPLHPSKVS